MEREKFIPLMKKLRPNVHDLNLLYLKTKSTFNNYLETCLDKQEFLKLKNIGGHKQYHLEGNALEHTFLVVANAIANETSTLLAFYHDVGKIYTSIEHGENDWTYPNHSVVGGEKILRFINSPNIAWYITNHIKPLFWKNFDDVKYFDNQEKPGGCSTKALIELAIADIQGSLSVEPQTALLEKLRSFKHLLK